MARLARKYQASELLIYHVINRGILKQNIFHDQTDVASFLQIILRYAQRLGFSVYHWCIMNNHYHMIIKFHDYGDLSTVIGAIQQVYVRRYHKRYATAGKLFQNRFKSQAIEQSSYLLACARYVERNPLRAGLVTVPWEWPWSSARYYVLGEQDPIVAVDPEWMTMAATMVERRQVYRDWLLDEKAIKEEQQFRGSATVLGSEIFRLRMVSLNGRPKLRRRGRPRIKSHYAAQQGIVKSVPN